jgi:hypothetical protein
MTNQRTITLVVLFLGLFALLMGGGSIWLLAQDKPGEALAPIVGLAGTALGALASMLVSTRVAPEPAPQVIVNPTPVVLPKNVPDPNKMPAGWQQGVAHAN